MVRKSRVKFYAHTATLPDGTNDPNTEHWQLLSDHLRKVADLAEEFADPFGMAAEAKQAMDNIAATLKRHGSSFDNAVQCAVALADIKDWPAFNEVYRHYFTTHFPARMAFATGGLAFDARVEVQCNATVGAR